MGLVFGFLVVCLVKSNVLLGMSVTTSGMSRCLLLWPAGTSGLYMSCWDGVAGQLPVCSVELRSMHSERLPSVSRRARRPKYANKTDG